MQLHEREKMVRQAEIDLSEKMLDWMREWSSKLTEGEELKVVQKELNRFVASTAKYMIRRERHGDEDKPGGLA